MMGFLTLLISAHGPPPPPTPLWEESRPHPRTYRLHRMLGYGILAGSLLQVGLGWAALSAYENGQIPPAGLRTAHRVLGYTVVGLALTNSLLGSWNLLSLPPEQRRRKHYLHALLSWTATGGYVLAGILAYQARTRQAFDRYTTHRNAALAAAGATLFTVAAVIW